jgi:hypothetical protein
LILQSRALAQASESTPVSIDAGSVLATYAIRGPSGAPSTESGLVLSDGRILRIAATVGDVAAAVEIAGDAEFTAISASPIGLHDAEVVDGVVAAQLASTAVAERVDSFNSAKWWKLGSGRIAEVIA